MANQKKQRKLKGSVQMNLSDYSYPTGVHAKITDENLLEEAKKRGFYKSYCKWDDFANKCLLGRGHILFKDAVPRTKQLFITGFITDYLTSFTAEHAEKVAICAMVFSEFCIHPDERLGAAK